MLLPPAEAAAHQPPARRGRGGRPSRRGGTDPRGRQDAANPAARGPSPADPGLPLPRPRRHPPRPAGSRACAATARGRATALRGVAGGSGRRGRGPVAMATAAEGLPEAGAQPAKRKGPRPGSGPRGLSPGSPPLAAWRWPGPARPRPAPGGAAATPRREGLWRWGGGRLRGGPGPPCLPAGRRLPGAYPCVPVTPAAPPLRR